jgi:hypothetical protein
MARCICRSDQARGPGGVGPLPAGRMPPVLARKGFEVRCSPVNTAWATAHLVVHRHGAPFRFRSVAPMATGEPWGGT